jgi:hypothetical protein
VALHEVLAHAPQQPIQLVVVVVVVVVYIFLLQLRLSHRRFPLPHKFLWKSLSPLS